MPRYRVGDRVFDSHQEAQTHRDSVPDAPAIFVEPDEAPVDAYALVAKTGATKASHVPWIATAVVFAVEAGVRVALVHVLLDGHAPSIGTWEAIRVLIRLAFVWRVASVLSAPANYSRGAVALATMFGLLTALVLVGELLFTSWVYRAVARHDREVAALQAVARQGEAPPLAAPTIAPTDAGPPRPARPWRAFASDDGYRISFPGTPVVHDGRARLATDDGATFEVEVRPLRGRSSMPALERAVSDEVVAMARASHGAVLDQREHVDAATRLAERLVRIALPAPPRGLYARIVATRGQLWVATAVLPASDPDTDAATFLESLDVSP